METAARGATVVAADDDENVRCLVGEILTDAGYRVVLVADGPSAVEAVRLHRPDAVVVDGIMPGMTGIEVCQELKADPALADIPVVLFTGSLQLMAGKDEQVPCVQDVVEKGVDTYALVDAIESALKPRRTS